MAFHTHILITRSSALFGKEPNGKELNEEPNQGRFGKTVGPQSAALLTYELGQPCCVCVHVYECVYLCVCSLNTSSIVAVGEQLVVLGVRRD